ncbi:MAG: hypothetical protein AABY22_19710, partial [Nanoarchaeota archaeon]
ISNNMSGSRLLPCPACCKKIIEALLEGTEEIKQPKEELFIVDKPERIICSATWFKDSVAPSPTASNIEKGTVLCGLRHSQINWQYLSLTGVKVTMVKYEQGFLTSLNRFVDRYEGLQIALKQNQVLDLKEVRGKRLQSEDLY